jgi:hypothetical protein
MGSKAEPNVMACFRAPVVIRGFVASHAPINHSALWSCRTLLTD